MRSEGEKRNRRHRKRRSGFLAVLFLLLLMTAAGCGREETVTSRLDREKAEKIWSLFQDMSGKEIPEQDILEKDSSGKEIPEQDILERDSSGKEIPGEDTPEKGISEQNAQEKDSPKPETSEGGLPALSVKGTGLVDPDGNPVVLRGISTHGLAWYPEYVNEDCFAQLKEEWGADVIRLAMYTAESGGYCTGGDKEDLKALIRDGVTYATDCGLYVIIDWHILSDGNPNAHLEEAKAFFDEMSEEYADSTNVIYEICNEPNGGTSWSDVKSYAEQVIDVIRGNDSDGVILVGTPNWCQYLDQAAADPITDRENIMYTLHFYAATHRESLRKTLTDAVDAGLPVFVSEYGICDASGNGGIDRDEADRWIDTLEQYGISYVAWNLSNKAETSALLKSSCSRTSGFGAEDLSETGKWLYELLTGESADGAGNSRREKPEEGGDTKDTDDGRTQSGRQDGGQSEGENSRTEDGAQDRAPVVLNGGNGLQISAVLVNSWEQDGRDCLQYTLTITNTGDTACSGWTAELDFDSEITLSDGWNGSYQVSGSRLTVSSVDYNGEIAAGASVEDVGFIVSGEKGFGL